MGGREVVNHPIRNSRVEIRPGKRKEEGKSRQVSLVSKLLLYCIPCVCVLEIKVVEREE